MGTNQKPTLTPYERRQIQLIEEWKQRPPPPLSRAFTYARKVAGKVLPAVEPIVRRLGPILRPVVDGAGESLVWLADKLALRQGARAAGNLNRWLARKWAWRGSVPSEEIRLLPLEVLDREARKVRFRGIAYGGLNGGIGGAGGILVAIGSMATAINIATRTVRLIGLCYGYDADDELEHQFIMKVLEAASAESQSAKATATHTLERIALVLRKTTWKAMADSKAPIELGLVSLRQALKNIGIQMTKRRAAVAVPFIGGGIGLLLDGDYLRSVGEAAMRMYQERWLCDREKYYSI